MNGMGRVCVCVCVCMSPSLWKNEQLVLIFVSVITTYTLPPACVRICVDEQRAVNTNEKFLDVLIGVINNDDDSMTTT